MMLSSYLGNMKKLSKKEIEEIIIGKDEKIIYDPIEGVATTHAEEFEIRGRNKLRAEQRLVANQLIKESE